MDNREIKNFFGTVAWLSGFVFATALGAFIIQIIFRGTVEEGHISTIRFIFVVGIVSLIIFALFGGKVSDLMPKKKN